MELILQASHSIFWFVTILSIIVFVHEFGHYFVARINGVKVETFAIGFGRELFGWNDNHGTRWKVCMIPMGGYVKMFGDADPASSPDFDQLEKMSAKDRKVSFYYKTLPQKAAIVAAGPIANYLLAIVILIFIFTFWGRHFTETTITIIAPESPAAEAGIIKDDKIIAIDGRNVYSFEEIKQALSVNLGTPIELRLQRDATEIDITITPKIKEFKSVFGDTIRIPLIGIGSDKISYKNMTFLEAIPASFRESYNLSASMLKAVWQIITLQRSSDELAGPVKIAKISGHTAEQGFASILNFIVLISINLGLVNLFPIPVLDGGHLMVYLVEAIRGKAIKDKHLQVGYYIGGAFLLMLTVYVTFNDIMSFFK